MPPKESLILASLYHRRNCMADNLPGHKFGESGSARKLPKERCEGSWIFCPRTERRADPSILEFPGVGRCAGSSVNTVPLPGKQQTRGNCLILHSKSMIFFFCQKLLTYHFSSDLRRFSSCLYVGYRAWLCAHACSSEEGDVITPLQPLFQCFQLAQHPPLPSP